MSHPLDVLEDLLCWRSAGHRAVLLTVCSTWATAPIDRGALCAIREDGRLSGSVSGGRLEDELIDRVRSGAYWSGNDEAGNPARLLHYAGAHGEPGRRLPSGASLVLALEPWPDPAEIQATVDALRARKVVCRELDLDTGRVTHADVAQDVRGAVRADGRHVRNILRPAWRLLTVGRPDIAKAMARLVPFLGFEMAASLPASGWTAPTGDSDDDLALDPLTIVLTLDVPCAPLGAFLRAAAERAGASQCLLAPQPDRHARALAALRADTPVFPSSGRKPEEIAVSMLSALIELRAGRLDDGAPAPATYGLLAEHAANMAKAA